MKTNQVTLAFLLLVCILQSCSDDDFPTTYHFKNIIELPAIYIDIENVDIKHLNIVQVTIVNSQDSLLELFTKINTEIPSEISQVDFEKYSFLYVADVTKHTDVMLKNDLKKVVLEKGGLSNYTFTSTAYYKDENLIKDPINSLVYYTGIVVEKIDNDSNITFVHDDKKY